MPASQDMLKDWHEFYLLFGPVAATLVGMLFVAASIGAGFLTAERASATRIYTTPVIFHFTNILSISLVVLVPSHVNTTQGLLISLSGIVGAVCSTVIFTAVLTHKRADWTDRLAYGVAPVISYKSAVAASVLLFRNSAAGPELLASGLVLLLLADIRNAWELTLLMARYHNRPAEQ